MPDKLYRSHSIEFSEENTSGSLTIWEDSPVSPFEVGDSFSPIPNGPALTVDKVSIKDNVIGELHGKTVRQWEITIEGSNSDNQQQQSQTHVKYNFNISENEKSGTMEVVNTGNSPAITLDIGDEFSVPGIGTVTCVKVSGNDSYDDDDVHSWTVTYEGSDNPEGLDDTPETKYNFSIDENGHSGSMSVTVSGNNPVLDLQVGSTFNLPGVGNVKCTKITGSDDGSHVWDITYEGSLEDDDNTQSEPLPETKYSFSIDDDAHSGNMTVINEGNAPALNIEVGDTFSIPGIGAVTCVKVSGNDEYTDSGAHRWNVTYEGSDAQDSSHEAETLPETKYSLSIEKDNEGDIQKSGSMSVVNTGNAPVFDVNVGSQFSIPGIGNITCTKVSANDDYSESGTHRWTVNYEGIIAGNSDDDPQEPVDTNAKYSFSIDDNSRSGSLEVTATGNSPVFVHNVGDTIILPGIGEVTCSKISGSDSYSESGKRKWTVVYDCSNEAQSQEQQNSNIKYSLSIENNSDGVTIYSGSKEFSTDNDNLDIHLEIGDSFTLPVIGNVTCTKIQYSNNDDNSWNITIEGSRGGSESGNDDDEQGLLDNEITINYEINGSTVRSVAGEFIALRRSENPITKKSITVYTSTAEPIATPGSTYEGGIVTSENISHETIKNNGVITASYYKHSIEVES